METILTSLNAPVFIVDDHSDHCLLIHESFKKIFPAVTLSFFANGMEMVLALEKKVKLLPRFIMLEMHMPLMCGIETLKWLRKNKLYKAIPVVMFTTNACERDINLCYQLGANSYLIKPFQPAMYFNIVEGLKRYLL